MAEKWPTGPGLSPQGGVGSISDINYRKYEATLKSVLSLTLKQGHTFNEHFISEIFCAICHWKC